MEGVSRWVERCDPSSGPAMASGHQPRREISASGGVERDGRGNSTGSEIGALRLLPHACRSRQREPTSRWTPFRRTRLTPSHRANATPRLLRSAGMNEASAGHESQQAVTAHPPAAPSHPTRRSGKRSEPTAQSGKAETNPPLSSSLPSHQHRPAARLRHRPEEGLRPAFVQRRRQLGQSSGDPRLGDVANPQPPRYVQGEVDQTERRARGEEGRGGGWSSNTRQYRGSSLR